MNQFHREHWRPLLLPPQVRDVRQTDHGHSHKNKKIGAEKIVPIGPNRNSQCQHSPFEHTGLPPFQRKSLEWIHTCSVQIILFFNRKTGNHEDMKKSARGGLRLLFLPVFMISCLSVKRVSTKQFLHTVLWIASPAI